MIIFTLGPGHGAIFDYTRFEFGVKNETLCAHRSFPRTPIDLTTASENNGVGIVVVRLFFPTHH